MLNRDSKPLIPAALPGNCYANAGGSASLELGDLLRSRIAADGPLDFASFMATALYHPELGYYARGSGQVGRGGDFFTSVSVGPVFGGLLARRFHGWWETAGSPARWRIIECGAHDGTLAHDVLGALSELSPPAFEALEYVIAEPLPRLRVAQQRHLAEFHGRVRWVDDCGTLADEPLPGVAFGNEVIDALPCHVVEWRDGRWHLCRVGYQPELGFCWRPGELPIDSELASALAAVGGDFPDGYRTEVRTLSQFGALLKPLLSGLSRGLLLWLDYGFARPEYYHPARTEGTLRAFAGRRALPDPLQRPGEVDPTAPVDFTAPVGAGAAVGLRPRWFGDQGSWLTALARPWLLAMEDRPEAKAIRQFQTLTHPGHLGSRFHVLELSWQDDGPPPASPATLHRLALQDI